MPINRYSQSRRSHLEGKAKQKYASSFVKDIEKTGKAIAKKRTGKKR